MGLEDSYYLLDSHEDLSVGEDIFLYGFCKESNGTTQNIDNTTGVVKIFINEKYLHLVAMAIDSEGILHSKRFPGNSSFRGPFGPDTSPCCFISTSIGTLHLKVNAQNG